jgi:hypothetical protein
MIDIWKYAVFFVTSQPQTMIKRVNDNGKDPQHKGYG